MAKLFVSGRALMSSSIQFMTTKCKTGAKTQTTTGGHKISRRHHQRASVADIAQSDAAEGSRSAASCAAKPGRSKATLRVAKPSKSKTSKFAATEMTSKDTTSRDISLPNASGDTDLVKSTAKSRREPNTCKAASSLSAAWQNRGKATPRTPTPSVSKRHAATVRVHGHQVQGCPKANEKRKTAAKKQQRGASGENLNASSSVRHLRCARHAAKTVSYTIRCGQREPKSSNKNRGLSRGSGSSSVTRAARVGHSVSPRAHLIPFPKVSLLKLTRRAATLSFRANSSVADNVQSTNSDIAVGGEVVSPDAESLGPASYMPASSRTTSISNTSSYLEKSESRPARLKKISRGGVVRTRIVRKKKTPCFADGPASRITQTGMYNSAMNPCDGGKLNASQAISVVFNDSNRDSSKGRNRDTEIDEAAPGNAAFSLASSSELMSSCSAAAPSKDLATSVSDSKTNSHKRRARASGGGGAGGCLGRHNKVHVTRIRRSSARPLLDANNNADSPDEDDPAEKRRKPQKKQSDEDSESDESADPSSRSTPESPEEKDSPENSSSKSFTGTTESAVEREEPVEEELEIKSKVVKAKKIPSKRKEHKEVKKSPVPQCPLFQGWDFGSNIGEHSMDRLPDESDIAAQLTKRAKYNIWESKGRPHNIFSMVGSPITIVRTEHEDLKSYLARHSIEEFVQHLTSSVLAKPEDESVVKTLIDQAEYFKQTLKFDTDTDGFLRYVFRELGDIPIAFPTATKTRNIEPSESTSPVSRSPTDRRSYKKSFDIVIGMPGVIYDPRFSGRLSARSDTEHPNTLQVGYDHRPYFDSNDPSGLKPS